MSREMTRYHVPGTRYLVPYIYIYQSEGVSLRTGYLVPVRVTCWWLWVVMVVDPSPSPSRVGVSRRASSASVVGVMGSYRITYDYVKEGLNFYIFTYDYVKEWCKSVKMLSILH